MPNHATTPCHRIHHRLCTVTNKLVQRKTTHQERRWGKPLQARHRLLLSWARKQQASRFPVLRRTGHGAAHGGLQPTAECQVYLEGHVDLKQICAVQMPPTRSGNDHLDSAAVNSLAPKLRSEVPNAEELLSPCRLGFPLPKLPPFASYAGHGDHVLFPRTMFSPCAYCRQA